MNTMFFCYFRELAVDLLLQVPNNELLLAKCCSRFSSNVVEMNQLHKRVNFFTFLYLQK